MVVKLIKLVYSAKNKSIRIFGNLFVNNNWKNCKIIYENKASNLTEQFRMKNKSGIKLRIINDISNLSYMFYKCLSLESINDISILYTHNITNISYLFSECSLLKHCLIFLN